MLSERGRSAGHGRGFAVKKAIVTWHIFSSALFLLTLSVCGALSSNMNEVSPSVGKVSTSSAEATMIPTSNPAQGNTTNNETDNSSSQPKATDCTLDVDEVCPENVECRLLGGECIDCDFNTSCQYGSKQKAKCSPKANVTCLGDHVFERTYECRYCYQLPEWQTWCNQTTDCALNKPRTYWPARPFFVSTCWARSEHLCMGRRCFPKQLPCNWSKGYKWSKAMLLSIFFGGFGVDRFYLGFWMEAIGKLLSFGGLGVWTLVDVILISVGYIGPSDGSIYI